jgi:hypothetical protein
VIKSGEKLIPAVSGKNKGMVFDLWSGYHYPGMGDESLKHRRAQESQQPPIGPLETADNIRSWLATGIPNDPNETVKQMEEDMQQAERSGISSFGNSFDQGKLSLPRKPNPYKALL